MISVIVPVYKAEKYLHRCIDSILAQTYTDFELLLIDDGSPDRSGEICDEYAKQDSRVRVFHKTNGGVSSARNLGLDNAKGDWITFVDADDYIHLDFLKEYSRHEEVDLVVGSFKVVGSKEEWAGSINERKYNIQHIREEILRISLLINFQTPWAKFFRREIIIANNLKFDEKIFSSEDWLFVLNYLKYSKSIQTNNREYYFYDRSNLFGLSQNSIYFESYFYAMDAFYENVCNMKKIFGDCVMRIYTESVKGYCTRQVHYLYYSKETLKSKRNKLLLMCQNMHIQALCKDTSVKRRKKIRIFHKLICLEYVSIALIYLLLIKGRIYD